VNTNKINLDTDLKDIVDVTMGDGWVTVSDGTNHGDADNLDDAMRAYRDALAEFLAFGGKQ